MLRSALAALQSRSKREKRSTNSGGSAKPLTAPSKFKLRLKRKGGAIGAAGAAAAAEPLPPPSPSTSLLSSLPMSLRARLSALAGSASRILLLAAQVVSLLLTFYVAVVRLALDFPLSLGLTVLRNRGGDAFRVEARRGRRGRGERSSDPPAPPRPGRPLEPPPPGHGAARAGLRLLRVRAPPREAQAGAARVRVPGEDGALGPRRAAAVVFGQDGLRRRKGAPLRGRGQEGRGAPALFEAGARVAADDAPRGRVLAEPDLCVLLLRRRRRRRGRERGGAAGRRRHRPDFQDAAGACPGRGRRRGHQHALGLRRALLLLACGRLGAQVPPREPLYGHAERVEADGPGAREQARALRRGGAPGARRLLLRGARRARRRSAPDARQPRRAVRKLENLFKLRLRSAEGRAVDLRARRGAVLEEEALRSLAPPELGAGARAVEERGGNGAGGSSKKNEESRGSDGSLSSSLLLLL